MEWSWGDHTETDGRTFDNQPHPGRQSIDLAADGLSTDIRYSTPNVVCGPCSICDRFGAARID